MASLAEIERIEALERNAPAGLVLVETMGIIARDGGDQSGRMFAVLDRLSERSAEAAMACALSFKSFNRKEAHPGQIETYFEIASSSDAEDLRKIAMFGFGIHLLEAGTERSERGLKLLRMSRRLGHGDASAELGRIAECGLYGESVDLEAAVRLYVEATKRNSATGQFLLAMHMLDHRVAVGDYHPLDLMRDAANGGHPDAGALVERLVDAAEKIASRVKQDAIMPYKITPNGMARSEAVLKAILNEVTVPESAVKEMIAALHGYMSWEALAKAAADTAVSKGKFDEDCSAAEYNERERLQTEIFETRMEVEENVASVSIKLLRPTASTGTPSLRSLDKIVDRQLFRGTPEDLMGSVSDLLKHIGLPEDALKEGALRTVWPLQTALWLDTFESHGWKMRRRRNDATTDGDLVCVTEASDGRLFKVFMSTVSYDPGDRGDEQVEKLMTSIAKEHSAAVLLFNHPRISVVPDSRTRAAFYGGRIFSGGVWWDFLLRKGSGIDDALEQKTVLANGPTKGVLQEFAFDGAVGLAFKISAKVTDQPEDGFGLMGTISKWSSPLPEVAIKAARVMKAIGDHDT